EKESTSQSGVFVSPSPEDNASAMRPAAPPVEPAAARDVRRPTSQAFEPTPAPFELDPRDAMPHPGGQASAGTPAMPPPPAEPAARWPKLPDIESLRSAMAAPVTAKARRALVVDDSLVTRMALGRALERAGFVVEGVERASEM